MSLNLKRVRALKEKRQSPKPVVYWMSRDQRVHDNWALLYAQKLAYDLKQPFAVVFCLAPQFLDASIRAYDFMIRGLMQVEKELAKYDIPFYLLSDNPPEKLAAFVKEFNIGTMITDFSPLKISINWKKEAIGKTDIAFYEVDAHNIVPCREASDKLEYAAYTFRPKITCHLPEYLEEFPAIKRHKYKWSAERRINDWRQARKLLKVDSRVPEISWLKPGESQAIRLLYQFLEKKLPGYDKDRNDPTLQAQSQLSPYLHFGQISAHRVALETQKFDRDIGAQESFLEELIVRRELADNFCWYNSDYDSFEGFPSWAKATLNEHRKDIRAYQYSLDQFELAQTHDDLWNACQMEMVCRGKMHGYMRMYWAKKILEWSKSPEDATKTAIFLNDKYELDGRDPNGYAGIAWSIGGVHDRAWRERPIFGKIRYMSYDGCKRKFSIPNYIDRINKLKKEYS